MRATTPLVLICFASTLLAVPDAPKPDVPAQPDDPLAATAEGTAADPAEEDAESAAEDAVLAALSEAAEALVKQEEDRKAAIVAERKKAKDEAHDTLTTIKGKTYNKVVISGVDDAGIRIRHEAGTARLKFPDVPIAMQERFGYDPDSANQALNEEKAREAERIRASLAGLRAEAAAKDPRKAAALKRATASRPPSPRRTSAPRPTTTPKPKPTGSKVSSDDPVIARLQAKIDAIQAGMKSVEDVALGYEKKAIEVEQAAVGHASVGRDGETTSAGVVNQGMLKSAMRWRDKAAREYEKLRPARDLIAKYRKQIKQLKTGIKQK